MTVSSVDQDVDALTLTLVADFDAPAERVWALWDDPRRLERWWGPPTHPSTFERHELTPGGTVTYFMTAPDGQRHHGLWRVTAVDPPRSLEFEDAFADESGRANPDLPVITTRMTLSDREGGARMELRSTFASTEQMEQVLAMGTAEGITQAVGQMDALLAQ